MSVNFRTSLFRRVASRSIATNECRSSRIRERGRNVALLHIFDTTDPHIAATAAARGGDRTQLPVTSGTDLISGLDGLVNGSSAYDRILFETHGSPGRIYINGSYIDSAWVSANLATRNYRLLCPGSTRIYFNGCNVAESSSGWDFMRSIARTFLLTAGGSVFGHTSLGLELPIWSSVTGHVVHLGGETRTLYVAPGGRVVEQAEQDDI